MTEKQAFLYCHRTKLIIHISINTCVCCSVQDVSKNKKIHYLAARHKTQFLRHPKCYVVQVCLNSYVCINHLHQNT